MVTSIIGAKGEMAKNLLLPLLKTLGPVAGVDKAGLQEDWQRAWSADVIWLSVRGMRFQKFFAMSNSGLNSSLLIRVIKAVSQGEIERGVFAMANSGSGAYDETMHAMAKSQFDVLGIYGMEILQCLLVHPSIKDINQIKEVFGHPQAVSQCKRTFEEKYPQLKLVAGQDSDDTALCAKRIADGELSPTTATLASQVAAKLYGLNVLEYGMHHDPFNTTTFLVIKKK